MADRYPDHQNEQPPAQPQPPRPFCDIHVYINQETGTVMIDNDAFVPGIIGYTVYVASSGGTGGSQYPCYGKMQRTMETWHETRHEIDP